MNMRAETHRALALIAGKLAKLDKNLLPYLIEGAEAPDKLPDYTYQSYITYRGRVRYRKVRVRHHGAPFDVIKSTIIEARREWLKGRKERAAGLAGRVLHYIGDGSIVSPSVNEKLHEKMERECAKIDPRSLLNKLKLVRPVGKRQTLEIAKKVQPAENAVQAILNTLTISFGVISSIFSSHKAPEKFLRIGKKYYNHLKTNKGSLFILSVLFIVFPILDVGFLSFQLGADLIAMIETSLISLGWFLIPSWVMGLSGMIMFKSNDLNRCLYSARRMYKWMKGLIIGVIVSGIILFSINLIPLCLMTIITGGSLLLTNYFKFFRLEEWRRIKDEIDWFKWMGE